MRARATWRKRCRAKKQGGPRGTNEKKKGKREKNVKKWCHLPGGRIFWSLDKPIETTKKGWGEGKKTRVTGEKVSSRNMSRQEGIGWKWNRLFAKRQTNIQGGRTEKKREEGCLTQNVSVVHDEANVSGPAASLVGTRLFKKSKNLERGTTRGGGQTKQKVPECQKQTVSRKIQEPFSVTCGGGRSPPPKTQPQPPYGGTGTS